MVREPNKFEEEIRNKLNEREIQPSAAAWTKLEGMLSAEDKPRRRFPWWYVAASVLGFLLVGTVYFSLKKNPFENQKNEVVIQQELIPENKSIVLDSLSLKKEQESYPEKVLNDKKSDFYVVNKESEIRKKDSNKIITEKVLIENKLIQEESTIPTKGITVEELLARVDKSARMRNNQDSELKVHVNPNELLQQVETDLEPTFRQRVFSKVAENYEKVKGAVVNRNQE